MKIILTGGGTGGHFYPLIAVAEEINRIVDEENIAHTRIYYVSDSPYNEKVLYENRIIFKKVTAGKVRLTFSLKSFSDFIKIGIGLIEGFFTVFSIFPDVVFSKGGYASVPAVFAARILRIPIIIHESDSIPGRANKWAGKFAQTVAVSYKQQIDYFSEKKIIHTGQPIRHDLLIPTKEGAHEFLKLNKDIPIIWVLGGSLGAQAINLVIEKTLPYLLEKYQIVHQVGEKNYDDMKKLTDAALINNNYRNRYHMFAHLNPLSMKMLAGISDVVITRAGSSLFEIAHWGIPAIVIPIPHSNGNHQVKNAYNYARAGAGVVIEENNLSEQLLVFEINRIFDNKNIKQEMIENAKAFSIPNAAEKIAKKIISIGLAHEK